jgi:3-oxoacyl-[acyl-carrier-protein] synthase III
MTNIPIGLKSVGVFTPDVKKEFRLHDGSVQAVSTADKNLTTFMMAESAFMDIFQKSNIDAGNVEHFIYMNDSFADHLYLMNSRSLLSRVGVNRTVTYNMFQGGNSSLLGCKFAIDHLKVNSEDTHSFIGASSHWEYHSENRALGEAILGDGSAVAHFKKGHEDFQFISFSSKTVGKYHDINYLAIGGYRHPLVEENIKNGEFVFKVHNDEHYHELKGLTVSISADVLAKALVKARLELPDIDLFVFHSHTASISSQFVECLQIPNTKVLETVPDNGYMGSAGTLLALDKMMHDSRIDKGSNVAVVSLSVDGNFSAAIVKV